MHNFSLSITFYIIHFILLTHHHNCTWSYCCKFIDLVFFSLIHLCLFLWSTPVHFSLSSLIQYVFFFDPLLYSHFTINSLIHSVFSWIHRCMFYWSASSCCRSWFLLLSNSPSLRSLSEEPLSPPYQWTSHSHEQVITMDQSRQPTNQQITAMNTLWNKPMNKPKQVMTFHQWTSHINGQV